jgi:hypothetical protein
MKKLLLLSLLISFSSFSQEQTTYTYNTFNSSRIINSHSVEMMEKKTADFKIGHRFGDLAGTNGGIETLFGIDNAADIAVGLEYGVSNNFNLGITRYKGSGPYRQLYEGYAKFKILAQSNKMPISLVALAKFNVTSMTASTDSSSPTSFPDFVSRTSSSYQLLIGRKFSERLSLQIMPTYVHRSYVGFYDQNGTFAIGAGGRLQLTKLIGIIGEYHYVIFKDGVRDQLNTFNPIALGLEFDTGGHIFQLNFSNSRGFGEAQYIPSTYSNFMEGQFRFGFSISRVFKL